MMKFYQETYGVDYGSGKNFKNGDKRQYGLSLSVFFDEVIGKKDLYELVWALRDKGTAIGPYLDFYKELNDLYEKVSESTKTKGRLQ